MPVQQNNQDVFEVSEDNNLSISNIVPVVQSNRLKS